MEYRRLGRTELSVSLLGVGCGYLSGLDLDVGRRLLRRAFDLGCNYFDGRYGDSNAKLRPLLADHRPNCHVVCKTRSDTAGEAMARVEEDLADLGTEYIDIYLLRTYSKQMLQEHLAPGGAMEGLLRAKEQGKVRFVGLSGHTDLEALVDGAASGLVDVLLFPLNLVRREALDHLVPVCQEHDVGMSIMKPVSVGMVPADLSLRWLANQPIHTMVPGMSCIEHLEIDIEAVERRPVALTAAELEQVQSLQHDLLSRACHQCEACEPCPEGITPIFRFLYSDVWYNQYRNMGMRAFLDHPWAPWAKRGLQRHFERRLAELAKCTHCGLCQERCPHGVRILDIFDEILGDHPPLIEALKNLGWAERYADAPSPYH